MTLIIGITGYFGSGKTTVGKMFQGLGAHFINADQVVHDLYKPGQTGLRQIKKQFGAEVFRKNQTINRQKLGQIVFKNPVKLKKLESIIHPLVMEIINNRLKQIGKKGTNQIIIIESIKFPRQLKERIDKFILIKTTRSKIFARIKHKYPKAMVKHILQRQTFKPLADFIIVNNASVATMEKRVKNIYNQLKKTIN